MIVEEGEFKKCTMSEYTKRLQDENVRKLTQGEVEVPSVLVPPEARRY